MLDGNVSVNINLRLLLIITIASLSLYGTYKYAYNKGINDVFEYLNAKESGRAA